MLQTPLYEKHAALGARMGQYCGAAAALAFSDPRREFLALRSGCGIYDLGWRAKFKVSGKDRVRWLNGMVTNNTRDLPPGRGNYSFLLNPQGRIQGDLYAYNLGDYYLASTDRSQLENVLKLLQRYIIMDQVELTDISGEITALAVQGPQACDVLVRAGLDASRVGPMQVIDLAWNDVPVQLTQMADKRFPTYELWLAPALVSTAWDRLVAAGATPAGLDALEIFRVAAGMPRYGQDIRDRDLPQETGQQHALNFNKGCYIGQEIVERIRSRGNVHRCFAGLTIEGPVPASGTRILAEGKEVGEITSALKVPSGDGERTLALGYLRRETARPGAPVQVHDSQARVVPLPFPEADPQTY